MVLKVTKQTAFLKRQISRITVQRIKFAHILDQQNSKTTHLWSILQQEAR
jgi:hypothetical protein